MKTKFFRLINNRLSSKVSIDAGTLDDIREDMQTKLDLYSAVGKITAEEYTELTALLNSAD